MANVIWDIGGVNHVEFLSCRATIKSEHCCHVVSFVREKNSLQGQYFNTDDKVKLIVLGWIGRTDKSI